MLKFEHTQKEEIGRFAPWFSVQRTHIGDYSLGFQFMWHRALAPDYAFFGDCLLLKEVYAGKTYFYYPLSLSGSEEQEEAALCEIERYCRDGETRLHYTNVPREKLYGLLMRYGRETTVTNNRRWRDYLYRAEDFCTYGGGKYAGQRNHVRKFRNLYGGTFRPLGREDVPAVEAFLREYERSQRSKHAYLADEEMNEVYEILPRLGDLGLVCGGLEAEGRLVAFSAGERCGDMLVVHIEKALREYEGAYPTVAQEFARAFCVDGVRFLNRMDDAGDAGLRKSKLQYGPCELVDKFNLAPKRAIDEISRFPEIVSQNLTLAGLEDGDAAAYARLASDVERNRFWGYDWREDHKDETPPPDSYFIMCAREDFAKKREMPLGVYVAGRLAGEAVLHRFGYRDEAEIGVRLLPEAEGRGYAREAVRALAGYAFCKLNLERVEAKCFRENARSRKMLLGAGMKPCGEDETYFYFYLTPEM